MSLESTQNPLSIPDDFEPATRVRNAHALSRPSLSYWQDAWLRLKSNRQAFISLGMIVGMLLFTLIGPWLWRSDPANQDLARISEPPSFGRSAVVLAEADAWQEVILPDQPESPPPPVGELAAPASVEVVGIPSTQGVRLKWTPVPGAA